MLLNPERAATSSFTFGLYFIVHDQEGRILDLPRSFAGTIQYNDEPGQLHLSQAKKHFVFELPNPVTSQGSHSSAHRARARNRLLRPGLLFSKISGILILIPPMPDIVHQSPLWFASLSLRLTWNQTGLNRTFQAVAHLKCWPREGLYRVFPD